MSGEKIVPTTRGQQAPVNAPAAILPNTGGEENTSAWLVVAPLLFAYNCYAVTFNFFFALDAKGAWLHIIIGLLINIAIFFSYPNTLRKKLPGISDTNAYYGIGAVCLVGCLVGYFSGNQNTEPLKEYYNSFFSKSFNGQFQQFDSIREEIKKGDDAGALKILKYQIKPKLEELIKASGEVEAPEIIQKPHEDYVKHLNRFKAINDDISKSLETQNAISAKAAFEALAENQDGFQKVRNEVYKIAKENGLILK